MKIIGNRILVSRVGEEKKEGEFQKVDVLDSFMCKGKVEQIGYPNTNTQIEEGSIVIFAKYSPHTEDLKHEGKDYKIVRIEDVQAIL